MSERVREIENGRIFRVKESKNSIFCMYNFLHTYSTLCDGFVMLKGDTFYAVQFVLLDFSSCAPT